jgi:hypothetical protein
MNLHRLARLLLVAIACFAPFGAIASSAEPPAIDVRDHGATGDGTTDDTAAIERAVAAGGRLLRFGPGRYRITRPIEVALARRGPLSIHGAGAAELLMAGPGPALRFLGTHAGTADPKSVKPLVWDQERTPRVTDLAIVGAHPEADGIEARGTMQLALSGLDLRRLRHGIHLAERNRNVLVTACHIYELSGIGLWLDEVNLHQINVTGCHVSYCGAGGIVVRGGDVRNLHVTGCDIESCMAAGGPPTANLLIDARGGSIGEIAITGCTLQHNHDAAGSANIRILGPAAKRTWTDYQRDGTITITGNILSDVWTNLEIRETRGVTITGNTLWQGYAHNLLIEDSSHVVVGPNLSDRSPRYNYSDAEQARLAVIFRGVEDSTISGLQITGVQGEPAGLILDRCRRVNLTGVTVLDSDGAGLLLRDCRKCRVSGCLFDDGRTDRADDGLRTEGGAENVTEGGAENVLQP